MCLSFAVDATGCEYVFWVAAVSLWLILCLMIRRIYRTYWNSFMRCSLLSSISHQSAGSIDDNLSLARFLYFVTFASGGSATSPGVSKLSVVERSKKMDCSRRVLAIGSAIFYPRSKFNPVLGGQRSDFREVCNFSTLLQYISKTINRSDIKLSPACSPFNAVQTSVSLHFFYGIFLARSVPEGNSVTPSVKSPESKLGQWP